MPRTKTITDDEVLKAAREVFLGRGASVSTNEIAKHVGLSQATLFQRFGSKNELLVRALRPEPVDVRAVLGPAGECDEVGVEAHLVLLAERLFDIVTDVMQRLHVFSAAGMMNPDIASLAHDFADAQTLVVAIESHFESIPETREKAQLLTKALLMLVHGAIAQSLQHVADKNATRNQLREVVGLLM